jgi:hypothetical protein
MGLDSAYNYFTISSGVVSFILWVPVGCIHR